MSNAKKPIIGVTVGTPIKPQAVIEKASANFLTTDNLESAISTALETAKNSGDFKGADGATPEFKIDDGKLWVRYDGGSWNSLGDVQGEGGSGGDCQLSEDEANYLKNLYIDSQYSALKNTKFTMTPTTTTYEMGANDDSTAEVTYSWEFNKTPTSINFKVRKEILNDDGTTTTTNTTESLDNANKSHTFDVPRDKHAKYTYTLSAGYEDSELGKTDPTVALEKTISVYNKYYFGCKEDPADVDGAFIKSLGASDWAISKAFDEDDVTCEADQYVWYAYPKRLGTVTMYQNTFKGGFESPMIVEVTNDSGFKEEYYVYRSINAGVSLPVKAK